MSERFLEGSFHGVIGLRRWQLRQVFLHGVRCHHLHVLLTCTVKLETVSSHELVAGFAKDSLLLLFRHFGLTLLLAENILNVSFFFLLSVLRTPDVRHQVAATRSAGVALDGVRHGLADATLDGAIVVRHVQITKLLLTSQVLREVKCGCLLSLLV